MNSNRSDWVPVEQAASQLGVHPTTIRDWHRKAYCFWLERKARIERRREKDLSDRWKTQLCIHRHDVERISSRMAEINDIDEPEWIPVEKAALEIGVTSETLHRWHRKKFCPELKRAPRFKVRKGRYYRGRFYDQLCIHRDDKQAIESIRATKSKAEPATWIRLQEASAEIGIPIKTMRQWHYRGYCSLLGKKARIEWRWEWDSANRFRNQLCIHRDDLELIQSRQNGIDPAENETEWIPVAKAGPSIGFQGQTLRKWFHHQKCPPLGRKARIEQRRRKDTNGTVKNQLCIHRSELELIRNRLTGWTPEEPPEWVPVMRAAPALGRRDDTIRHWHREQFCPPLGRRARFAICLADNCAGIPQSQLCIHRDDVKQIQLHLTGAQGECGRTPNTSEAQSPQAGNNGTSEGNADCPIPVAETPHVKLFGMSEEPIVNGRVKRRLTRAQYGVVKCLIDAFHTGETITKDLLPIRAGSDGQSQYGARQTFYNLRKADPDWAEVLLPSGDERLGYRII